METGTNEVKELTLNGKSVPSVSNVCRNPKREISTSKSQKERRYSLNQSRYIDEVKVKPTSKIPRLVGTYSTISKLSQSPNRVYQLKTKGFSPKVETQPILFASHVKVRNSLSNFNIRTKPDHLPLTARICSQPKYDRELVSHIDRQLLNQIAKTVGAKVKDILGNAGGDDIPIIHHLQNKRDTMEIKYLLEVKNQKEGKRTHLVEQIVKKPIFSHMYLHDGYTHTDNSIVNDISPTLDKILEELSEEKDEKNSSDAEMQKILLCNSSEDKDDYSSNGTSKEVPPDISEILLSDREENCHKKVKIDKKSHLKVFLLLLIFLLNMLLLFIGNDVDDCQHLSENCID